MYDMWLTIDSKCAEKCKSNINFVPTLNYSHVLVSCTHTHTQGHSLILDCDLRLRSLVDQMQWCFEVGGHLISQCNGNHDNHNHSRPMNTISRINNRVFQVVPTYQTYYTYSTIDELTKARSLHQSGP